MTGYAICLCILEAFCNVALLTGANGMLADQRECAEIVVECYAFVPAMFIVAGLALLALLTIVCVINFVTA